LKAKRNDCMISEASFSVGLTAMKIICPLNSVRESGYDTILLSV